MVPAEKADAARKLVAGAVDEKLTPGKCKKCGRACKAPYTMCYHCWMARQGKCLNCGASLDDWERRHGLKRCADCRDGGKAGRMEVRAITIGTGISFWGMTTNMYRIEHSNLDGWGRRPYRVYDMAPKTQPVYSGDKIVAATPTYWPAITDIPCPTACGGTIRWAEAGYVPGYRVCDTCGRHFLGGGTAKAPTLRLLGTRRYQWPAKRGTRA